VGSIQGSLATRVLIPQAAGERGRQTRAGKRNRLTCILNTDDIRQSITAITAVLTLLVAAIAIITLAVGGIGRTNMMLV
jgi:hypothetical protein